MNQHKAFSVLVVLAILVAAFFPLGSPSISAQSTAHAAWDNLRVQWDQSNLKGYRMLENVPHRFRFDASDLDKTLVFSFVHDYENKGNYGYVNASTFSIVEAGFTPSGMPPFGDPSGAVFSAGNGIFDVTKNEISGSSYLIRFTVTDEEALREKISELGALAFYWHAQLSDTSVYWKGNIQSRVDIKGYGQQTINFDPGDLILDEDTPILTVTKEALPATYVAVGDTIDYIITVQNTGNVPLTNIEVNDATVNLTEMIASLDVGASTNVPATYNVTQGDLDAGVVNNTATASTTYNGTEVSDSDSALVIATQSPALFVTKMATPSSYTAVGAVINYDIEVENTGNVTLTNIVVSDPTAEITEGSPISSLAPGAKATVTATYEIDQEDLDVGTVLNTATASTTFNSSPVTATGQATITAATGPDLSITKHASPNSYSAVGEVITYTIRVTNEGNVTLTNIVVTDDTADTLTGSPIASLAPQVWADVTATYTITQADLDAGTVVNVATVTYSGYEISKTATATVTAAQSPELTVAKEADVATYSDVGDVILYTITVTNTGNVTLTNIVVEDPLTGLNETILTLAPNAYRTFEETYLVTQNDLNAGSVSNTATATTAFAEEPVGASDTEVVDAVQISNLDISKEADVNSYNAVGQVITYTITVTNTGNVTLTNIVVEDPLTGLNETILTLAPNAYRTFEETYLVTQNDLNEGAVSNTARATAGLVIVEDSETVVAAQNASIALVKTGPSSVWVGNTINYTITVTNNGNVLLYAALVEDELLDFSYTINELSPGQSMIFAGQEYGLTYLTSSADVTNGVANEATVVAWTHPLQMVENGYYNGGNDYASVWASDTHFVTVNVTPPPPPPTTYTLIVNSSPVGSGTAVANPSQVAYNPGTVVVLTATANTDNEFIKWVVDGVEYLDSELTITMNSNRVATAYFEPEQIIIITPTEPEADPEEEEEEILPEPPLAELPKTGGPIMASVALGAGLMALGFALRRRKTS